MYLVKYSYRFEGVVVHNSVVLEERELAPYFKRYHTDIEGFEKFFPGLLADMYGEEFREWDECWVELVKKYQRGENGSRGKVIYDREDKSIRGYVG